MKYLILLVDGMADYNIESLGNKTPLDVANIPMITKLAQYGEVGLVQTIPPGMQPGSDTANLSVMGYAPEKYHTGRSPLEAASMGISLEQSDVTFRCNLVTLSNEESYEEKKIIDHSSGDITTEEAEKLIIDIKKELDQKDITYYPGVSYRHLILWKDGPYDFQLTPPHDVLNQKIISHLPKGPHKDTLLNMMKKSHDLLKNHPINKAREERGLNTANSIWIWGEGKKPTFDDFKDKFGICGSVISAVDLIHGIGILAGLNPIKVDGATGTLHTNFEGKAQAAIDAFLDGDEFIYLHIEAPDECGHQGDLEGKIRSIELIDKKVLSPIKDVLDQIEESYRILILPDHRTPIHLRTHTSDPVPYVLYDSSITTYNKEHKFSEKSGETSGIFYKTGPELATHFFNTR